MKWLELREEDKVQADMGNFSKLKFCNLEGQGKMGEMEALILHSLPLLFVLEATLIFV